MLEGVKYGFVTDKDNTKGYLDVYGNGIWVENGGKREYFECNYERGYLPDKVQLFDDLIKEGKLGRMDLKEYITNFKKLGNVKTLKEYYSKCVITNNKLENLFGTGYVDIWEGNKVS